ncbi:MAG: hypothetical protein APU95_04810 [Hadesarchaea archaeon YNP_N21]|jgi:fructose-bisphosphate aldolase/2-amino-3,7-dideoxy-D-threo-hept-6-ulosonate synthase|nr:MAG: hypothetical protein APU95_04810 [Hadesarchaea archaeon YNP_N21]
MRWNRIVKRDGRTVIVAMDHGTFAGPMRGIEKPGETIEKMIEGGADAMLLTPGTVAKFADIISGNIGAIVRVDGSNTLLGRLGQGPKSYMVIDVRGAVKLGGDGVVAMGYIGSPFEIESLAMLSKISQDCMEYGMPLLAEMFPSGPKIQNPSDPEIVKLSARVGAEIGADFIKTHYTGDPKTFSEVVESTPVPIVILGGPKRESIKEVLADVKDALSAGAIGVAFGRNIWQAEDPVEMLRAVVKIVHENASVEEAMAELK